MACGTIAYTNWPPASFIHIGAAVYVPKDLTVETTLTAEPDTYPLGPFYYTDKNVEPHPRPQDRLPICTILGSLPRAGY